MRRDFNFLAWECLLFALLILAMQGYSSISKRAGAEEKDVFYANGGYPRGEYLILVNSENPLDEDYVPADLVDIKSTRADGREIQKMRKAAADALESMILEMKRCGVYDKNLSVTSGYRSFEYQKYLFDTYVKNRTDNGMSYNDAYKEVSKTTALPGCSEHQSGLCADFHNKSYANISFAETEQYKWIEKNAHLFGFIVRYPKGKENITGISFEPWHLRYVGEENACKIYENSLCLEEYLKSFDLSIQF